ncbi:KIR protein [Plasmodium knowlesi strain H]|uniref:KIR protein n=3 Tax=Plasmodium knowlesi TaxID=5850 RepID=A0A5K1U0Z0_PLAKH|nr:KIR protein [Plasmodium knowlesi strain H]OTN66546.1 KIR protein [Plasmodium knowlesi]CAA9990161.1 KIR protein [Plasmodium knowlesi strain H]SBO25854.1 KIR protein [Plasmodium knowlesi strain H]SBO28634.1 KIR protein [Plasmodium knowlesi strain H]VVS79635.1 KIR protein [Plasmodium knowlesi strain H]|eukprot:XP_002260628.1 KIR protein [Plasmodium knowlesi strain H]
MSESKGGGKELKCNKGRTDLETYKNQLEQKVRGISPNGKNAADDVPPIWCCLSETYDLTSDNYARCDLIYYIVGSIIYNNLTKKDSFDSIMKEVHDILGKELNNDQCTNVSNKDGKKLFGLMEKLSYYNLDPIHVWEVGEGDSEKVNCEGCANYLEELARACKEVETYCTDERNNGKCGEIELEKTHQGSPGYLLQLIYNIIPELEATLEAEMTQEKHKCLRELPSDIEHRTFSDIENHCTDVKGRSAGEMKRILRGVLGESGSPWNCANQIIRGACYSQEMDGDSSPYGERCTPLYYYIGNVISTIPASVHMFATLMKATYDKLKDINVGIKGACTNLYEEDKIDKTTFENMKLIYDYSKDYKIIQKYAQIPQDGEYSCTGHYSSYLDKVLLAYDYMEKQCPKGSENNKQWCQEFKEMTTTRNLKELLQLKSSLQHISSNSTAAITGSAVGGTLFTLGLPLAAFLSYKYDLLPSGIRKFFLRGGSGTRMRRTAFGPNSDAEMENFTEYYTENGSTTTDPTEYSTVAGSSSNLTTTSTEDSSILYNEDGPARSPPSPPLPRKKRGGGNNRRGQNISYHSMER